MNSSTKTSSLDIPQPELPLQQQQQPQQQQYQPQMILQQLPVINNTLNNSNNINSNINNNNNNNNNIHLHIQPQQVQQQSSTSPFFNKLKRRMDTDDNDGYHFQSSKKFLSQNLANKIGFLSLSDNEPTSTTVSPSVSPPLNGLNNNSNNLHHHNSVPQMDMNNCGTPSTPTTPTSVTTPISNPFCRSNITNNNNNVPFSTPPLQPTIFNDNNETNTDMIMKIENNNNNNYRSSNGNNNSNCNNSSSALALVPISNINDNCHFNDSPLSSCKSKSELLGSLTNKYNPNDHQSKEIDIKERLMNFSKLETIKPINLNTSIIPQSILKPTSESNSNRSTAIILYSEPSEVLSGSLRKEIVEKRKQLIERKGNSLYSLIDNNNNNNNSTNNNMNIMNSNASGSVNTSNNFFNKLRSIPESSSNTSTPFSNIVPNFINNSNNNNSKNNNNNKNNNVIIRPINEEMKMDDSFESMRS
ncbi:hypothetical protein ACTFIU_000656 [Dictyostelium citrinum]